VDLKHALQATDVTIGITWQLYSVQHSLLSAEWTMPTAEKAKTLSSTPWYWSRLQANMETRHSNAATQMQLTHKYSRWYIQSSPYKYGTQQTRLYCIKV